MARRAATARMVPVVVGALLLGACGSSGTPPPTPATPSAAAPSTPPAPDPAVKPYCDAVARVQTEQASPQAGQGGVPAASATAHRQLSSLVATAPPEIAGDWRVLDGLTNRALGALAATGGDPKRIDRRALDAISQQAQPTVAHIKSVTERRCGVAFSAPGAAPGPPSGAAPGPPPGETTGSTSTPRSPSSTRSTTPTR